MPDATDLLDAMRLHADPLADDAIARMLAADGATQSPRFQAGQLDDDSEVAHRLRALSKAIEGWRRNADLDHAAPAGTPPAIAAALQHYADAARALPPWADRAALARCEQLFYDYGLLSCASLFCASLPECYVAPDLSEVLHVTGQLEQRTDYRIRATAAMIFPVMLDGGLSAPERAGAAQVLKVRLIHATVRHLILRGTPAAAAAAALAPEGSDAAQAARVAPLASLEPRGGGMHATLLAHGWDTPRRGLPCNQEELAYTLLTFGYVFLRTLRRLGIGLPPADEAAVLHGWNVVGHLVGVDRALMAQTMDEADALFAAMQARGRARVAAPDPRPPLGTALMLSMERLIPWRWARPLPRLFTRHLVGAQAARDIGLDAPAPWPARLVFALGLRLTLGIDAAVRLVFPRFSIARFVTRLIGHRLLVKLLMDETRPLKLPTALREGLARPRAHLGRDPQAPRWLNALELRFAGREAAG